MPRRQLSNSNAFTLMELLVVLGIITVLAALLFSAVSRTKAKAQRIQCASNLHQLSLALLMFVNDSHVYPLAVNPNYSKGAYPEHWSTWHVNLQQTGLAAAQQSTNQLKAAVWLHEGVWQCPAAISPTGLSPQPAYFSYGYNGYGLSAQTDTNSLGLGGRKVWIPSEKIVPAPPVGENEVAAPADMLALGDGFTGANQNLKDGVFMLWRTGGVAIDPNSSRRSFTRHHGQANVAFCDGQVASLALTSLFADTSDEALARWNRDHLPHREKLTP